MKRKSPLTHQPHPHSPRSAKQISESLVWTDTFRRKIRNSVFFVDTWSRLRKTGDITVPSQRFQHSRLKRLFSWSNDIQSLQQRFFTQNKTQKSRENYISVQVVILSHTRRVFKPSCLQLFKKKKPRKYMDKVTDLQV